MRFNEVIYEQGEYQIKYKGSFSGVNRGEPITAYKFHLNKSGKMIKIYCTNQEKFDKNEVISALKPFMV